MKANELRIGNWIYSYFTDGKKKTLQMRSFFGLCNVEARIDDYEPIPLTGERLLEFGFETDGVTFYIKGLNPYRINLFNTGNNKDFDKSGFSVTVYQSKVCIEICRIQYVHQLQNLWFALTGEELTK